MNVNTFQKPSLKEKYDILGRLGSGTYGVVYLARKKGEENNENNLVAIKVMNTQKEGKVECLTTVSQLREVKFIKELSHSNIVKQLEIIYNYSIKELAIVFEYADYDLHDFISYFSSHGKAIPLTIIRNFMWQILKATSYLHSNWIMHRDLKPTNLLIIDNEKDCGVIRITDFGLARSFQEPIVEFTELEKVVVTLWYRAPELLLGCKTYTPAIDLWAIGCIFAKLLNLEDLFRGNEVKSATEKHPFQSNQCEQIFSILGLPSIYDWPELKSSEHYSKVSRWGFDKRMNCSSCLHQYIKGIDPSSDAFDLLSRLLTINPNKRITAKEALNHPFFTKEPFPSDQALPPKNERDFQIPPKVVITGISNNVIPTTPTSPMNSNSQQLHVYNTPQ